MPCRICGAETQTILNLGEMPPANRLKERASDLERSYPLEIEFCNACKNLQLSYCVDEKELYDTYFYVTPDAPSLVAHYDKLIGRLSSQGHLSQDSFVVEFGSNVGRFLQRLTGRAGRVLGVDPARNICDIAREQGVETLCSYFSADLASQIRNAYGPADVLVARHCAAHNKDPHELIEGVRTLLSEEGVFVMENAYGLETFERHELGQIYHEHMFYFTIQAVEHLFAMHDLRLIDILMAPVHGGSVVFIAARMRSRLAEACSVSRYRELEREKLCPSVLNAFPRKLQLLRQDVRALVDKIRASGGTIWLYGASAKASTFVNYIGLTRDEIRYCADSTPIKHGRFIPKANIEIRPEEEGIAAAPDYFLITAWNYADEIIAKVRSAGNKTSRFIIPHPEVCVRN